MKRFIFRSGDTTANIPADRMTETEYGTLIAYRDNEIVAFVNEKYADFAYMSGQIDKDKNNSGNTAQQ